MASLKITVFISQSGAPVPGLSPLPVIKIRDLETSTVVVAAGNMVDDADGFYSYDFTSFDSTKLYSVLVDAGATLADPDRYVAMTVPSVQVDNPGRIV